MTATHQRVLREWIIDVLGDAPDQTMRRRDVLAELDARHSSDWKADDLVPPQKRQFELAWQNRASFERQAMVREGVLVERNDGYWQLASGSTPTQDRERPERWALRPGEQLDRRSRAARYGGALYGGIEPSASTPNVFLYSDPAAGAEFGYHFDGWTDSDRTFLYTGEGPDGDQPLTHGNRAIAQHLNDGRALRLFVADGRVPGTSTKRQLYVGEFSADPDLPYIREDALGADGQMRSVLIFQLRPGGDVFVRPQDRAGISRSALPSASQWTKEAQSDSTQGASTAVALERMSTLDFERGATAGGVGLRRESELLARFCQTLRSLGHTIERYKIRPAGTLRDLYTDVFDQTDNVLYEAKSSGSRDAVRMAIGQLLDYRRHLPGQPRLALLVPSRPNEDLLALLDSISIEAVFPGEASSWCQVINGRTSDFRA